MNKKGSNPYLIIGLIILFILIFGGYLGLNFWKQRNDYIIELDLIPKNITTDQSIILSTSIFNPNDYSFNARIGIEYNNTLWSTNNYYLGRNQPIDLGRIDKREVKKYSIMFNPTYDFNRNPSDSTFNIILYDSNENKIEERKIYAKAN